MRTVYLAGPYAARDTLSNYASQLRYVGYTVRARWLDGTHEITPGLEGAAPDATPEDRAMWAEEDLDDVRACDVLVLFTADSVLPAHESLLRGKSGGRHVETGYAHALGKDVIVVGQPENVFHHLARLTVVPNWHEALIELSARLVKHERNRPQAVTA